MKSPVFFCLLAFLGLFSCMENPAVQRITVTPEIVVDSIETMFPGGLAVYEDYLVWVDAFPQEYYIYVYDLKTGEGIGKMAQKGQGPAEFPQAMAHPAFNNRIMLFDFNKLGIFSIDSLLSGKDPCVELIQTGDMFNTNYLELPDGSMLKINSSEEKPFHYKNNLFGKYPLDEEHENRPDYMQGTIRYNPYREELVYGIFEFPYMALYKKEEDSFKMKWDFLNRLDFSVSGNVLRVDQSRSGYNTLTLTHDYIVTLQRDRMVDNTDESKVGRDFSKLPTTIFLYDYNRELKKIINFEKNVVRIASDPKNNVVYLIVVDPDFMIVKYDLDNL